MAVVLHEARLSSIMGGVTQTHSLGKHAQAAGDLGSISTGDESGWLVADAELREKC